MEKKVILLSILALIFILPFATAQETVEDKARSCILDKVDSQSCSTFGLEDKIFSLLSTGKCKSELLGDASNNECFIPPNSNSCAIKTTSQAVLALDGVDSDTSSYVDWILSQNISADLDWLIQIENPDGPTSCTLKDLDEVEYQVSITEDKKLTLANSFDCLTLDSTGYWLQINPSCYDQEFEVSCNERFSTSLIFKKTNSQTIYVLNEAPKTGAAGGTTITEQVDSLCFKRGSSCSYEGTLWATLALNKLGYDVSSYLPYLIAFEENNEDLLPESFLYYLTSEEDFRRDLILKQKGNKYWDEAADRYYDTALALLPLGDVDAKDNAINWLTDIQGGDGCWSSGSVSRTGFFIIFYLAKIFYR